MTLLVGSIVKELKLHCSNTYYYSRVCLLAEKITKIELHSAADCTSGPYITVYPGTLASGLPKHSHISSFFLGSVYKAAGVTEVGVLLYLRARATLEGRLTFFLVNIEGGVN